MCPIAARAFAELYVCHISEPFFTTHSPEGKKEKEVMMRKEKGEEEEEGAWKRS